MYLYLALYLRRSLFPALYLRHSLFLSDQVRPVQPGPGERAPGACLPGHHTIMVFRCKHTRSKRTGRCAQSVPGAAAHSVLAPLLTACLAPLRLMRYKRRFTYSVPSAVLISVAMEPASAVPPSSRVTALSSTALAAG